MTAPEVICVVGIVWGAAFSALMYLLMRNDS